ncbi:MAG TPA: response regulator transcription factor [Gaiellaceae bacterium]|jgi:DNA-binding response OmpR family regulator|nr:response regulator transcription factor [Gaiellaceae bacterium]
MSQALLLAEAEPGTREFLERHLASDGFRVHGAGVELEALELAERERPDLVLVGDLLDASGLEVCRRLREGEPGRSWDRDVPVIVLGEPRADAVDRVHAFARGCDDFVPRPFHYEELVARIHAVLRRTQPGWRDRLAAGPIAVDRATRRVTVHGLTIALSAKEYEFLVKLAAEPTRVFTKEELLRDVWGFRSLGRTRTLDSHASRLRRKLARAGAEDCVLNVWGVGYRLIAETEAVRQSA